MSAENRAAFFDPEEQDLIERFEAALEPYLQTLWSNKSRRRRRSSLMRHPDRVPGRVERRRLTIRQQDPRPLDMARRLRSRARNPNQINQIPLRKLHFDQSPRRGHSQLTQFGE
jgi:hypothetical protein